MFASKTPRDLWGEPATSTTAGDDNTLVTRDLPGKGISLNKETGDFTFDHVQHNDPNPILVELRQRVEYSRSIRQEDVSRSARLLLPDLDYEPYGYKPVHVDHARRVLTRLSHAETAGVVNERDSS